MKKTKAGTVRIHAMGLTKIVIAILLLTVMMPGTHAQGKYSTNTGHIQFFSHTNIEDITAVIKNVGGMIDAEDGTLGISLSMKDFDFKKRLMEAHFNKSYVESDKFPTSTFKGAIVNHSEVDYETKGIYKVRVEGELTIHGVTNKIVTEGHIQITGEGLVAKTIFMLNPEDYEIMIPKLARKKIAKLLEITVDMRFLPLVN